MSTREDPYRNFRFRVTEENNEIGGFSEVTLPEASNEPIEYREGNDPTTVRKIQNLTTYGDLTLKRGITNATYFTDWWKEVREGSPDARRTITVFIQDLAPDGTDGPGYQFEEAWPRQYDAPDLNATANEVAVESLQLAHEGMKRIEP
jgi:phage tail-like protein